MRKEGVTEAILYINGSTPCVPDGDTGCFFNLKTMLAKGSKLTVYNKNGVVKGPFVGE